MIYTAVKDLHNYCGISQNLDLAIDYLLNTDLQKLEVGHHEIDGDKVYGNIFEYQTVTSENIFWESHIKYIDIHVDIVGEEYIIQGVRHH